MEIFKVVVLIICALVYHITNEPYDAMNVYVALLILVFIRKFSFRNSDFKMIKESRFNFIIDFSAKMALLFYLFHPYIIRIVYKLSNKYYTNSVQYLDYAAGIVFLILNYVLTFVIIYIISICVRKIMTLNCIKK